MNIDIASPAVRISKCVVNPLGRPIGQTANMSYDPREHFQQIQRTIQQRGRGFGGLPGGGGAAGRGVLALIALGVGGVVLSNSIFNGKQASVIVRFCTNPNS